MTAKQVELPYYMNCRFGKRIAPYSIVSFYDTYKYLLYCLCTYKYMFLHLQQVVWMFEKFDRNKSMK